MVAIGGSDKHGPHETIRYGKPTTWVLAKSHSPRGILAGLRNGTVCVSAAPDGPLLDLKLNHIRMGGTLDVQSETEEIVLSCKVHHCKSGILKIISQEGAVKKINVSRERSEVNLSVNADTPFYRAELWESDCRSEQSKPQAISNPVYLK